MAKAQSLDEDAACSGLTSGVWPLPARPGYETMTFAVHDAKNLLGALRANIEWLRSTGPSRDERPDVVEALEDIDVCCQRLTGLLGEALLAARGAPLEVNLAPVHMSTLVGCAVDLVRKRADAREIRLKVSGPDDLVVKIDRSLISRVLDNLLDNAIRCSRRYGTVIVGHGVRDGQLVVSVSDEGPGVPDDQRDRIFEPFVTAAASDWSGHVGLGLAFCRAVARAHHGSIEVHDRPSGGAMFVMTLQLGAAGHQSVAPLSM